MVMQKINLASAQAELKDHVGSSLKPSSAAGMVPSRPGWKSGDRTVSSRRHVFVFTVKRAIKTVEYIEGAPGAQGTPKYASVLLATDSLPIWNHRDAHDVSLLHDSCE